MISNGKTDIWASRTLNLLVRDNVDAAEVIDASLLHGKIDKQARKV
jgi:hypothetical protein